MGVVVLASCQSKAEPDRPPRPPRPVVEARSNGSTIARVVSGHPCRAEVDGNEMLVGTEPLVAQVGNTRWSGDDADGVTIVRRDGAPVVRLRDSQAGVEVLDTQGATLLKVSIDGAVANARGDLLRKAEASHTAIKIGDSIVTGTNDLALGVLVTAPELIPEVRALAACHRLSVQADPATRK
ncbi:MAG TPA: hypothetical protein VFP84_23160 [Kofleriaceae bacterium]|nr:hypothetical protein [Kofleriaceae bacterium]